MPALAGTFNTADAPPREPMDLIPVGEYPMQVIESEIAQTRTGGEIIKLTFEIVDGQHQGRRVWSTITWSNANPQAETIGRQQLAELVHACGLDAIDDTDQLHFKPLIGKVGIEKDKTGQYEDKNRVNRFKPMAGAAPAPAAKPAPAARPAATAAKPAGAPPWAKR